MADFCEQCSKEMGFENNDLSGQVGPGSRYPVAQWLHTICEGCGDAVVDSNGVCHSNHCLEKHGDKEPFDEKAPVAGGSGWNPSSPEELVEQLRHDVERDLYFEICPENAKVLLGHIERLQAELENSVVVSEMPLGGSSG